MTPVRPRPVSRSRRTLRRTLATAATVAVALAGTVLPASAGTVTTALAPAADAAAELEPTTIVLEVSSRDVDPGVPVTVTATVSGTVDPTRKPTGDFTFTVRLGTSRTYTEVIVPLVDGVATATFDALEPGPNLLTTAYAGSSTHQASTRWGGLVWVTMPPLPAIASVTPSLLGTEGGQTVRVQGADLRDATSVTFGGVEGRVLERADDHLDVQVPARPAGSVPVVVTTPAGSSGTGTHVEFVDTSTGVVSLVPLRLDDEFRVGTHPKCFQVTGTNRVPAGATGALLNVTVYAPYQPGYVTVYPDDQGVPPATSTVNFEMGREVANAAFVALSPAGRLCYRIDGGIARVVVDVTGYTVPSSGMHLQKSVRLLDTRPSPYGTGDVRQPARPGVVHTVQVAGRAGVPADATAVILNATATNVAGPGNLRVYPAGEAVPNTSVLNYAPGADKANAAVVTLSSAGKLSYYSDGSTADVILDVAGYVTSDGVYRGTTPTRVLDTRPGPGHVGSISGPLEALTPHIVTLPGDIVPAGATSVVLNVTAIRPQAFGNLRVYPSGEAGLPNASTLNYIPGRDIPNLVVVDLPDTGPLTVTLYSDTAAGASVHVAVDVAGFVVP